MVAVMALSQNMPEGNEENHKPSSQPVSRPRFESSNYRMSVQLPLRYQSLHCRIVCSIYWTVWGL